MPSLLPDLAGIAVCRQCASTSPSSKGFQPCCSLDSLELCCWSWGEPESAVSSVSLVAHADTAAVERLAEGRPAWLTLGCRMGDDVARDMEALSDRATGKLTGLLCLGNGPARSVSCIRHTSSDPHVTRVLICAQV